MSELPTTTWGTESDANRIKKTYVKGYMDVSGGELSVHNTAFNVFNSDGNGVFRINPRKITVNDDTGQEVDISLSYLTFLNNLVPADGQAVSIPEKVKYIFTVGTETRVGKSDASSNFRVYGNTYVEENLFVSKDASFGQRFLLMGDASLNSNLYVLSKTRLDDDLSLNGNFTMYGDASLNGRLMLSGDASLNSNLYVKAKTRLDNDLSLNGNLFLYGGDASLNGRLMLSGDASLNGNLYVKAKTRLGNDLSLNGNLFLYGGDASLNGRLMLSGDASLNGNLYVKAKTRLDNDLSLNGNLFLYGGDASLNGRLMLSGDASLNSNLYVKAKTRLDNDLSLNGNLFLYGGDASLNGRLMLSGDASLNGNLYVKAKTRLDNDLSLNGNLFLYGGDASLNGRLMLSGDASLNGNLYVKAKTRLDNDLSLNGNLFLYGGDASLNGRLMLSGDASLNGNLYVKSKTRLGNDLSLNGKFNMYGDASINGLLLVSKDASLNGNLYLGGQMRICEGTGTIASATTGSMILEHTAVGGTSSIMFKGPNSTTSDYAYIQYEDSTTYTLPLLKYDFTATNIGTTFTSTGSNTAVLTKAGVITSVAVSGLTPVPNPFPADISCIYFNQTNLSTGSTANIAYLETSVGVVNPFNAGGFTFSAWIRPITVNVTNCRFYILDISPGSSTSSLSIRIAAGGIISALIDDDSTNFITTAALDANTWVHYAFTFDNATSTGNHYLNGTLNIAGIAGNGYLGKQLTATGQTILLGLKYESNQGQQIGSTGIYAKGFHGYMNYVNMFDRALTASDIAVLYNTPGYTQSTINRGLMTFGIENDPGSIFNDRIALMPANGSGFVGINTKTPTCALDVIGSINATGPLSVYANTTIYDLSYAFSGSTALKGGVLVKNTGSGMRLILGAYYTGTINSLSAIQSSDYYDGVEHADKLLLNPLGGTVGIGTKNPTYTLDVSGSINTNNRIRLSEPTGSYFGEIYTSTSSNQDLIINNTGTGWTFIRTKNNINAFVMDQSGNAAFNKEPNVSYRLDVSGNLRAGATTITGATTISTFTTAGVVHNAANGSLTSSLIVAADIDTGAVTEGKIGTDAVTTTKIGTGAVTEGKIGALAVSTGKIADGAVTEGKIGTDAVTTAKIGTGAVTEGKIGALAVTEGKIGALAVTEGKIGALAVSTGKIADGAVTTAKLATLTGTVNCGNITAIATITALTFNATSDYRVKTDVKPLNASFNVDVLNPVTYTNTRHGRKDVGFIAHEVQEHYPFLVSGEKDGEHMQSLNYIGLIGILTKEIQDLKRRLAETEAKVDSVETDVRTIDTKVEEVGDIIISVEDTVLSVKNAVRTVDDKVSSVENKVSSVENTVSSVENKVSSVENTVLLEQARLAICETVVALNKSAIKDLDERLQS